MAKYTITHTCGHQKVYQIVGAIADRDRKVAWLESQDCPECRKAAEKAAAESAAEKSPFAEIATAELTGSEKQIAWAKDIRNKVISELPSIIPAAIYAETNQVFASKTEAKWWIDNRNLTIKDLVRIIEPELKAAYFNNQSK